jgi:hypothetical protein
MDAKSQEIYEQLLLDFKRIEVLPIEEQVQVLQRLFQKLENKVNSHNFETLQREVK